MKITIPTGSMTIPARNASAKSNDDAVSEDTFSRKRVDEDIGSSEGTIQLHPVAGQQKGIEEAKSEYDFEELPRVQYDTPDPNYYRSGTG
jgi:hypothetical protein